MNMHTPGPWSTRQIPDPMLPNLIGYAIDFNEAQEQIADFVYEEADACLIAAAPELLESLSNLVGLARLGAAHLSKYHAALQSAEAVIAKARGSL